MGGCRCIFRNCTVSTASSRHMHFFHFPASTKKRERFLEWVRNAGAENILSLPERAQKNRVVCARHFRDECFMNYQKNRLMPNAVPTLMRHGETLASDYSKLNASGKPQLVRLKKPTQQHLIAPPNYSYPFELFDLASAPEITLIDVPEKDQSPIEGPEFPNVPLENADEDNSNASSQPEDITILESDQISIDLETLNKPEDVSLIETDFMPDVDSPPMHLNNDRVSIESNIRIDRVDYKELYEHLKIQMQLKEDEHQAEISKLTKEKESLEIKLNARRKACKSSVKKYSLLRRYFRQAQKFTARLQKRHRQLHHKHVALGGELMEAKSNLRKQEQEKKLQAPTTMDKMKNSTQPPLTKPQLFGGIKKYLSSSMVSLVRMEMFGGSERPWKVDEKSVAIDLLQLGAKVYEFLRDEWRLRLPPIRDVHQWKDEQAGNIEEEDL